MKRAVIHSFCDMAEVHDSALVPATHEDIPISWLGADAQLDLCDTCYSETDKIMAAFMAIGGAVPRKRASSRTGMDRRDNDYYVRLKAYCAERGIVSKNKSGFKASVKREFDAWEREQINSAIK